MSEPRSRRAARLALGADAVFSVSLAAELLPGSDAEAHAWLHLRGLVREHPQFGRIVIWGDVLALIRADTDGDDDPSHRRPLPADLERTPLAPRVDVSKMPRRKLPRHEPSGEPKPTPDDSTE